MKFGSRVQKVINTAVELGERGAAILASVITLPKNPKGLLVNAPDGTRWEKYQYPVLVPANDPEPPLIQAFSRSDFLVDPSILKTRPVLMVTATWQPVLQLTGWFEGLGAEVATTNSIDIALDAIAENKNAWGLLVVFLDGVVDEYEVVEALLLVRKVTKALPIILVSSAFSKNDFSLERVAICDVSLKSPVSRVTVGLAVAQAIANNNYFNKSA
ncbi:hypothetical protein [Falsiruegeria litorea]|uniref:Response regulatory domain-containing protein n=1 Tax=Falsiruegeria litorea TaxID=1280831 RepID=A0ABS5WSR2_9RHOB|nr:hypothetical protein [Falsiruegeria litorea]MBT3142173.1 hypothetical protein [Falsiruegeria litorea]MBT8168482.1 hypothetical protein [Falsiruegeria litorea]